MYLIFGITKLKSQSGTVTRAYLGLGKTYGVPRANPLVNIAFCELSEDLLELVTRLLAQLLLRSYVIADHMMALIENCRIGGHYGDWVLGPWTIGKRIPLRGRIIG